MGAHASNIRIAVDAMGGDFAPSHVVDGAVQAVHESAGRFSVVLVGQEDRIRAELQRHAIRGDGIVVMHASQVVEMQDVPNAALKTKKDSSITVGISLHRDGNAEAFVSAGNTGAVLSASTLLLGRLKGVSRPTIGALVPTATGQCLLADAGTNVDCRPRHLLEFGVMGSIYVSAMLGKANPSVALLSIGEEETKGNEASLAAFALLRQSRLNFIGNVEGRDVLSGKADVVICDGFVGNILLKFGESIPAFFKEKFKAFASQSVLNTLIGLVARKGLRGVMKELDYQEHGGVPLLGVNGVSIIGHGGSSPKAIKNMIFRAEEMVQRKVNSQIQHTMLQYHE